MTHQFPCFSRLSSVTTVIMLLVFLPEAGRTDECNYDHFSAICEAVEVETSAELPLLAPQSHQPFAGCFERGKETQALHDIRAAIKKTEASVKKQRLPIVLVPGYLATDEFDFKFTTMDYWFGIVDALNDAGYAWVFPANIDPVGYSTNGPIPGAETLDDRISQEAEDYNGRSCQLKVFVEAVLQATGAQRVNLIAHSQGSLTARWMISNLDMADKVEALITVGGANRGVPLTELAVGEYALPKWMIDAVERVTTQFLGGVCHGSDDTSAHGSHVEMWPSYVENFFNPNCPDVEGVHYFSFSALMKDIGFSQWSPYLLSEFWVVHLLYDWMNVGPNDGLIDRASAMGPENSEEWTYVGELVGKKVIPGTGIESRLFGIYWGVDHGAFMNFPLGLTKYYHFNVERFYLDLARLLNAYSE